MKELPIITTRAYAAPASGLEPRAPGLPQVYIETFGCQMNEYDTELVRSLLTKDGFSFTSRADEADVVLLNTCAIRENAHNRVYGHLGELRAHKRRRHMVVGVLGCMAQNLKDELLEADPLIDVLVGPDAYRRLPGLLRQALTAALSPLPSPRWGESRGEGLLAVDLSEWDTYADIAPVRTGGVNAWIAIMRGCDNFCTFCVVPYTRGRERSRDPEGVIREAHEAAAQGHRQITLLGQNVNSYRSGDWDFARLIAAIADVPGIARVRFTSPHPKDFPPALLDAVAGHPKICKHIHLPLQSGNDRVLDAMNRTYTRAEYLALVDGIRRRHPGIALTTDIICGFCGESEEEFEDTYRTAEAVRFHGAFIFKYSERKHTIAARTLKDDVQEDIKAERVGRLVELQRRHTRDWNETLVGTTVPVLVESDAKKSPDHWMGRTETNITAIWPKAARSLQPGDLVSLRIVRATASTIFGDPA
jgi:tRNA-2-methylthio-N6-dimethylallyladenosine synthase